MQNNEQYEVRVDYYSPVRSPAQRAGLALTMTGHDPHGALLLFGADLRLGFDDELIVTVLGEDGQPVGSELARMADEIVRERWDAMRREGHPAVLDRPTAGVV